MTNNNRIKYLIKFVGQKQYADDLQNGQLYMSQASKFFDEEKGRGDFAEGNLFDGICISKGTNFLIYCMYAVFQNDIRDGVIQINSDCISEFSSKSGFIVLIDFDSFEKQFDLSSFSKSNGGYRVESGLVTYGIKSVELSRFLLTNHTLDNLFVKRPSYAYQQEYRIVIARSAKDKKSKTELIPIGFNVKDISTVYEIGALPHDEKFYYLPTLSFS